MHALVFADRTAERLLPMTRNTPTALLPVAGKTLLEHTLDNLVTAGIVDVTLIVREHAGTIQEKIQSNTALRKLTVRIVRAGGAESPTDVARRIAARLPDTFLALRGDVYREPCLDKFLVAAKSVLATQVTGRINGRDAQICLCRKRDLQLDGLSSRAEEQSDPPGWRAVEIGSGIYSGIQDITEFYLANLEALTQLADTANTTARTADYRLIRDGENATGIRGQITGPAILGTGYSIGANARLVGPVIVGKGACIENGAFLHACIIFPGSYIPANTRLQNAIVTEQMALDISGNTICRFADRLGVSSAA